MNYEAAMKECKRLGCAHATGDSLRAMYASLALTTAGIAVRKSIVEKVYAHLQGFGNDRAVTKEAQRLMRDTEATYDIGLFDGE